MVIIMDFLRVNVGLNREALKIIGIINQNLKTRKLKLKYTSVIGWMALKLCIRWLAWKKQKFS